MESPYPYLGEAFALQAREHVRVVEAIAPLVKALRSLGQVDRRTHRSDAHQGKCAPVLGGELEQHVAAERVAHQAHALPELGRGERAKGGGEVFTAARVILLPTERPRGAGAAQVEAQHPVAPGGEMAGGAADVAAVLTAAQAVDQHDEGTIGPALVQQSEQRVAAEGDGYASQQQCDEPGAGPAVAPARHGAEQGERGGSDPPGLEKAEILRPGYGIEHGLIDLFLRGRLAELGAKVFHQHGSQSLAGSIVDFLVRCSCDLHLL